MGGVRLNGYEDGLVIDMTAKRKVNKRLEDEFDKLLKKHKVTGYKRDTSFIPGRRFRADFWFPDLKLVFEVDGGLWLGKRGGHTTGVGAHRDRERDILAYRTDGILTFRLGTNHLDDNHLKDTSTWVLEIIKRRKDELNVR